MGTKSRRRLVAVATGGVLLFAALASGCVTTASQGRRMREDIDSLQVQVTELRKEQREQLAEGIKRIDDKLAEVNKSMEALGLTARRNDANFGVTVDQLITQLQSVRGDIETLRHQFDQFKDQSQAFQEQTEQRLAALKGDEALKAFQAKQQAKALEKPNRPGPFLALAKSELAARHVDVARDLLEEYLKRWPKEKGAAQARFLLGKSYFEEKAWRPAILELNKFREKWPHDPNIPEALYDIGESFAAIGLKPEAGKFFDALIKRHPNTPAARKARVRKKELGLK